MKKFLLPQSGKCYKANLHCHSTLSDGNFTPAEVKDLYKSKGYSIVEFSDHDALFCNYKLTDDRIVDYKTAKENCMRAVHHMWYEDGRGVFLYN